MMVVIFTPRHVPDALAGCALNDVVDRDFDAHVSALRTGGRDRAVSPKEALLVGAVWPVPAGLLLLPLNRATFLFALVALAVAACYPSSSGSSHCAGVARHRVFVRHSNGVRRRFFAGVGCRPLGLGDLHRAHVLGHAYDHRIRNGRREDDLKIGIQSSAILFGRPM